MRWRKLGRIFAPEQQRPWLVSHASVPTVAVLDDSTVRVFFSPRDKSRRSLTAWFDLDVEERRVVSLCEEPVLKPGRAGMFDDSGAMACCALEVVDAVRLYYVGWNTGTTVPFRNAIGLATAQTWDGAFARVSEGPILDRSPVDPCFVASPHVHSEADGWRMWYLSCWDWRDTDTGMRHYYDVKYATSSDGVQWTRSGETCIRLREPNEYAISRPWVVRDGGTYRMWFSYRGEAYRIGYAESGNGVQWERLDHIGGLSVSDSGWDSEMVEYPCVFDAAGRRYMLYNGNGYGATGIGLAILEE